jgi:hypothetical protein
MGDLKAKRNIVETGGILTTRAYLRSVARASELAAVRSIRSHLRGA